MLNTFSTSLCVSFACWFIHLRNWMEVHGSHRSILRIVFIFVYAKIVLVKHESRSHHNKNNNNPYFYDVSFDSEHWVFEDTARHSEIIATGEISVSLVWTMFNKFWYLDHWRNLRLLLLMELLAISCGKRRAVLPVYGSDIFHRNILSIDVLSC